MTNASQPHSTLVSRNLILSGHRTSVRLEPEMWDGLREISRRERASIHQLCAEVARQKPPETSLTAAIRVYVMRYFRLAATEDGHTKAGHGLGKTFQIPSPGIPTYEKTGAALLTATSFA